MQSVAGVGAINNPHIKKAFKDPNIDKSKIITTLLPFLNACVTGKLHRRALNHLLATRLVMIYQNQIGILDRYAYD